MKVRSKIFSKSAKYAFALLTICGALFTSCYEKEDEKLPEPTPQPDAAVYYIAGAITDAADGASIDADKIELKGVSETSGKSFSFKLADSGVYTLIVSKDGYTTVERPVTVEKVEAGQEKYVPVNIELKKVSSASREASYSISGTVKNKATGALIDGQLIIDSDANQTYAITKGVYKAPIASGSHNIMITAVNYNDYAAVISVNKVMTEEENLVINHIFDFVMDATTIIPEDKLYPVVAAANITGVNFTLTGIDLYGAVVSKTGENDGFSSLLKAGSYILKAEATDAAKYVNPVLTREFTIGDGVDGFSWNAAFEEKVTEPILYPVKTNVEVIVLDNASGAEITNDVTIVPGQTFVATTGANVIKVTDAANKYYGTTYVLNVDAETSALENQSKNVAVTIRLNKIGEAPEVPVYPVAASSNVAAVKFTLTGTDADGAVNKEGTEPGSFSASLKAGSYILKAEITAGATDYVNAVLTREFTLNESNAGYSWHAAFEKKITDPTLYPVKTMVEVITLDDETGAAVTGLTITPASPFEAVAGANVIRVTDPANVYYDATYVLNVDAETSTVENQTKNVAVTIRLTKKPITPAPIYRVKAVAEDANVLFNLYKDGKVVETARGELNYATEISGGDYYITAAKEGKVIDPSAPFTLDDNAPLFFWSVAANDMRAPQAGDINATPGQAKTQAIDNNNAGSVDDSVIPSFSVEVPADAVDVPVTLNISIIPTQPEPDMITKTATVLAFEGTPSGTIFNEPLKFTFKDDFGIGNLAMYYLENDTWRLANDVAQNENPVVTTDGVTYTALIPHFSMFKFGLEFDYANSAAASETILGDGNWENETNQSKTVKANYDLKTGVKMITTDAEINAVLSQISTITPTGQALVGLIIKDLIYTYNKVNPSADYGVMPIQQTITIPAQKVLKAVSVTQDFETQTFTLDINGIQLPVIVGVAGAATIPAPQFGDISHGHGHGNSWNAGGGIIVSE